MKDTKRIRFLNYLINLGIDVDSTGSTIYANYKNECIFSISDLSKYQMKITGNFKHLRDENIDVADLCMNIVDYASLEIEDRFKDIEIIRRADDRN